MSDNQFTIRDRLDSILESINLIQEWSKDRRTAHDFMLSVLIMLSFPLSFLLLFCHLNIHFNFLNVWIDCH